MTRGFIGRSYNRESPLQNGRGAGLWVDRRRYGTIRTTETYVVVGRGGVGRSFLKSGLADRLENGGGQRLGRALAGPHHVLEGGIEALAFADRHLDEVIELLGREPRRAAQGDGMAEHRQAFLGPQIEVPQPHLLVDQGQQDVNVVLALARDAHVVGTGEMQRLDVLAPAEEHAVVAPTAGDLDGDLPVGRAIERPVVGGDELLDHLERVQIDFSLGPLVSRQRHRPTPQSLFRLAESCEPFIEAVADISWWVPNNPQAIECHKRKVRRNNKSGFGSAKESAIPKI